MRRPAPLPLETVLHNAQRVVVIDGVVDSTNIGAIFRSAAALGIDAVLLAQKAAQFAIGLLRLGDKAGGGMKIGDCLVWV